MVHRTETRSALDSRDIPAPGKEYLDFLFYFLSCPSKYPCGNFVSFLGNMAFLACAEDANYKFVAFFYQRSYCIVVGGSNIEVEQTNGACALHRLSAD
jgi:hypothetical protein